MFRKMIIAGSTLALAVGLLAGCAGTQNGTLADWERQLAEKDAQISEMRSSLEGRDREIRDLQDRVTTAEQARQSAYAEMERIRTADAAAATGLFPPAKPGQCYTRVFVPAEYETVSEQVLKTGATSVVEVVPARYEWVEERVLVKEASSRLEEIPAEYEWVEEQVLVKPAHTTWKKGRGLVERVDNSTGEIMCLVEVPAEYKTVRKRVEVKPATTREVTIPAEYETVKVRKMVAAAHEKRTEIPAEYQTVTSWVKVSEGHMEWREVMCETNLTMDVVKQIQLALRDNEHNPGPIDGIIGHQTSSAIESYQKNKGLAVGGLTYETVESLGVDM